MTHPAVVLILANLSEIGATLYRDERALTIESWPGTIGAAFWRAIDLHAAELMRYAEALDPWHPRADENAPTEHCETCGGATFFRPGDNLTWTCTYCQPGAERASYHRALAAPQPPPIALPTATGARRQYPRTVRPWDETKPVPTGSPATGARRVFPRTIRPWEKGATP